MRRAIMFGHQPCAGTVTDGLEKNSTRTTTYLQTLMEESRNADHCHVDETGWKMFVYVDDKENYRWWLWVFYAPQKGITLYVLDPSRSSKVPMSFFKAVMGILNVDGFSSYGPLEKSGFIRAFCWFHLRRDFINCSKDFLHLNKWAAEWVDFIHSLYAINDLRVKAFIDEDIERFKQYHKELIELAKAFEEKRDKQLESEDLHEQQRKILQSMKKNRDRYFIFVDNPFVPMDNNAA